MDHEIQIITNSLSTDLAEPQHLTFRWGPRGAAMRLRLTELTTARCRVTAKAATFRGSGQAAVEGKKGYKIQFSISVARTGRVTVKLTLRQGTEVLERFVDASLSTESIS